MSASVTQSWRKLDGYIDSHIRSMSVSQPCPSSSKPTCIGKVSKRTTYNKQNKRRGGYWFSLEQIMLSGLRLWRGGVPNVPPVIPVTPHRIVPVSYHIVVRHAGCVNEGLHKKPQVYNENNTWYIQAKASGDLRNRTNQSQTRTDQPQPRTDQSQTRTDQSSLLNHRQEKPSNQQRRGRAQLS